MKISTIIFATVLFFFISLSALNAQDASYYESKIDSLNNVLVSELIAKDLLHCCTIYTDQAPPGSPTPVPGTVNDCEGDCKSGRDRCDDHCNPPPPSRNCMKCSTRNGQGQTEMGIYRVTDGNILSIASADSLVSRLLSIRNAALLLQTEIEPKIQLAKSNTADLLSNISSLIDSNRTLKSYLDSGKSKDDIYKILNKDRLSYGNAKLDFEEFIHEVDFIKDLVRQGNH